MEEVVDWQQYFSSIKTQCPWSLPAFVKGEIDIQHYQGHIQALGNYRARMYLMDCDTGSLEALAESLDSEDTEYEWFFSYPGYGRYASPVPVLIQQSRAELDQLRRQ